MARPRAHSRLGPLMGGNPISPVDFKKWQCPLSLFFRNVPGNLKMVQCRLSNLRNTLCHVSNIFSHVDSLHLACRFKKRQCRPVEFKGQLPQDCSLSLSQVGLFYGGRFTITSWGLYWPSVCPPAPGIASYCLTIS